MKKFYITTSIAYVNAAPHLGYVLELIESDAVARYHRKKGEQVHFVTGTDEHGAKIARSAEVLNKTPREFTDEISEQFRDLKKSLVLSWDDFIRTSDSARHWPGVTEMWKKLEAAGDIYKKKYEGLYCVGHEAFITKKELVNGKCIDHDREPERIEEENYFFRLSKYSEEIGRLIATGDLKIFPVHKEHEILSLIKSTGLEDVSFSRPRKDLTWGIPVPGDESQTIYVWADALTNYLSVVGYPDKKYEKWWPADLHVIGKDILRFHAAIWPGMLLSAGLPLPRALFVHGFVTVNGKKMSKTIGNVLGVKDIAEKLPLNTAHGVDALRYYFLREIPSGEDGDFSFEKLFERYEADLVHGLGNFISRVGALAEKEGDLRKSDVDDEVLRKISKTEKVWSEKMEEFKLHEAVSAVWELIGFGDAYINKTEPWKTRDKKALVGLSLIVLALSDLIEPFMPQTATAISKLIEQSGDMVTMKKPESPLFPKIA